MRGVATRIVNSHNDGFMMAGARRAREEEWEGGDNLNAAERKENEWETRGGYKKIVRRDDVEVAREEEEKEKQEEEEREEEEACNFMNAEEER